MRLLPTPRASANENRQTRRTPSQEAGEHGLSLAAEVCTTVDRLLPTPNACDADGGHLARGGDRSDEPLLAGVAKIGAVDWGDYEPAIRRHEAVLGRPHPAPTNPTGGLSPLFVEWMMMLPAGWVTDVVKTKTAALRALGNGVVPPAAAHALAQLIERTET